VGRGCRFADLRARAEAGVQPLLYLQPREGVLIQRHALGLPHRRLVPVEAKRPEIVELAALVLGARTLRIEILDAHEKARRLRAREQPRDQRGAQAAEVQRPGRRGGEAPVASVVCLRAIS
jgi:hypothetical protein